MNASEIQQVLIRERFRTSKVWPNYTSKDWWECDVFEVTPSGYFCEYEIKLTLSNFRADFEKRKSHWHRGQQQMVARDKHQQLLQDFTDVTPRRFFFVCPSGLIPEAEVPAYAGLIYVSEHLTEHQIIRAPERHRLKVRPAVIDHAHSVCYYRWHTLLAKQK